MKSIRWNTAKLKVEIPADYSKMRVHRGTACFEVGLLRDLRVLSTPLNPEMPSLQPWSIPWDREKPEIVSVHKGTHYLYLVVKSQTSVFGLTLSLERDDLLMFGVVPHHQEGGEAEPSFVEWPGAIRLNHPHYTENLYIPYATNPKSSRP